MIYRSLDFRYRVEAEGEIGVALRHALSALREPISPVADTRSAQTPEPSVLTINSDIDSRGDPTIWRLETDGHVVTADSPGLMLARVLEVINQRAASSLSHEVPLHAATVASPTGGLIALAGPSGAGKSTLGLAATRFGWLAHAEEISAVDPTTLEVRPYHRPIGLRRGGADLLGISYPASPDDGSRPDIYQDVYPFPVDPEHRSNQGQLLGIAIIQRSISAPAVTTRRPAQALAEIMEHVVVPDDDRVPIVFRDIENIVRRIPVVRLNPGTPVEGIAHLDRLAAEWK